MRLSCPAARARVLSLTVENDRIRGILEFFNLFERFITRHVHCRADFHVEKYGLDRTYRIGRGVAVQLERVRAGRFRDAQ